MAEREARFLKGKLRSWRAGLKTHWKYEKPGKHAPALSGALGYFPLRTQSQGWGERKVSEATGGRGSKAVSLTGAGVGATGKVQDILKLLVLIIQTN